MKLIQLTRGQFAKVDDDDFERLSKFRWHALSRRDKFCAVTFLPRKGEKSRIMLFMHRFILGEKDGPSDKRRLPVDHINHDSLDNRKINLRVCSTSQNMMNRSGPTRTNRSGIRGIHWHAKASKWRALIKVDGKNMHLGLFLTKEEAGAAYVSANKKYFGEFGGSL